MFCARCGKQIEDDSTFCPFCGQQVDAPVTGTKFNISFKEGINAQAKKWLIGAVAGLVAITGVTVGAVRLIGGSDDKEPVVAEVEESKPVAELPAEASAPTEAPAEEPVSEEPVDDSLHTVSRYEISNILQEFFQAHLGCYISYCYGNCKTVPKNVSSMLEHTMGPVSTIDLARMVVSDYDDSSFYMEISTNDISKETHNNDTVNYRCSVSIEDINIYGDTFTYYEGTDAEIGVVAKLDYIVNDKSMAISNNYVACVLDNSTSNPDKWLIAAAVFTNQSAYEKNKGNIFEKMLFDENIDPSTVENIKSTAWKEKYLSAATEGPVGQDWDDINAFILEDINSDGVPELYLNYGDYNDELILYLKKDGSVGYLGGTYWVGDLVWSSGTGARHSYDEDIIYKWNAELGDYEDMLYGSWSLEDEIVYEIDGVYCSESDYYDMFKSYMGDDYVSFGNIAKHGGREELLGYINEY